MTLQFEYPFEWRWLSAAAAFVILIALLKRAGWSSARLYGALAVRLAILVLIFLALANPVFMHTLTGKQCVLFVLDLSESISAAGKSRALQFMREVKPLLDANDAAGLIAFARTPRLIHSPAAGFEVSLPPALADADATDIARALELGLGEFPSGSRRTMVLLSDGNENLGRATSVAALAQKNGVTIHTAPLESSAAGLGGVEKLFVPSRLHAGEKFKLRALLKNESDTFTQARLTIRKNGEPIAREILPLAPGTTPIAMDYKLNEEGLHCFDIQMESAAGKVSASLPSYVQVAGMPEILIVSPEAGGRNFFNEVIRSRDFEIESRAALPNALEELLQYECVVLNDVPRRVLPDAHVENLHHYVQDFGGGLVTIGGGAEASLAEFDDTPLEKILPITLDKKLTLKNRRDFALILLIDRSASMAGPKLEMAKAAALNAVNELEAGDSVGILAFDESPYWIVDLMVLKKDKTEVLERLRQLALGGGTDVRAALEEVHQLLSSKQMNIRRHLILITDGLTSEHGLLDVTNRLAAMKVTLSTIAIGRDANVPILDQMRQIGQGEFHVIQNFNELPRIVVRDMDEKVKLADEIDEKFTPQIFHASPILTGIRQKDLPSLRGYVTSELKHAAKKPLMTNFKNTEDPILAHWQYGLGRSTVFTAGVNSTWSDEWLRWRSFGKFWEQTLRWTMRTRGRNEYFVQMQRAGSRVKMRVEIESLAQTSPAGLRGVLRLPGKRVLPIQFERTATGIFEGAFSAVDSGRAQLALAEEGNREASTWFSSIYLPGYLPPKSAFNELDHRGPNFQLLQDLAQAGNGIFDPRPDQIVKQEQTRVQERSFRGYLLALALLLLLLDVAVRRLEFSKSSLLSLRDQARLKLRRVALAAAKRFGN